jgi:hypothetical protein
MPPPFLRTYHRKRFRMRLSWELHEPEVINVMTETRS